MSSLLEAAACETRSARETGSLPGLGTIGSWRLERLIYEGRLCRVYRAAPLPSSSAGYALKLLLPQVEEDHDAIAAMQREAAAQAEVSHANLLPLMAAHVSRPPYYLVSPWLEGKNLRTRLASNGPLPPAIAFCIARQAAQALDALCKAGWIHGDVKPDNVMVSPRLHATLLDLGFARKANERHEAEPVLCGTLQYMAPERFDTRRRADIRADVYSLGVMLFEMLTGSLPLDCENADELIAQHRGVRAANLRQSLPLLPRDAAATIARMLAKEPLRRPMPGELIAELAQHEMALLADR